MRIVATGNKGQVVSALLERRPAAGDYRRRGGRHRLGRRLSGGGRGGKRTGSRLRGECQRAGRSGRGGRGCGRADRPLSTNDVFSHEKAEPYAETDAPGPVSVYGRTKPEGERRVAAAQPDHAILRTASVYFLFGANVAKAMLRLAQTRDMVGVVADQRGTLQSRWPGASSPIPRFAACFISTSSGEAT